MASSQTYLEQTNLHNTLLFKNIFQSLSSGGSTLTPPAPPIIKVVYAIKGVLLNPLIPQLYIFLKSIHRQFRL